MSEWRKVKFLDVYKIQGGSQPPKKDFVYEPKDGFIRLLQIRDFGDKPLPTYVPITNKLKICSEDDVLIGRYGGQGKILTGMAGAYNVAIAKVIIPKCVSSRFTYHLLKSDVFYNFITSIERSTIDGFNKDDLSKLIIKIPPTIEEQQQIVERLEVRLEKLNNARTKLDKIPLVLKCFRQSVLASACSGKLTGIWREGKGLLEWEDTELHNFCSYIVDCPHSTPKWTECGKLCVRTTNFKPNFLDLSIQQYVSEETFNNRISRLKPMPNDILYSREGGILGIACIIPENVELCLGQRMMLMRTSKSNNPKFLMYILNSPIITSIVREKTGGSASPHLNVGEIKKFVIPHPPIMEQEEIVRRVDKLFSIADCIEERYKIAKNSIKQKKLYMLKLFVASCNLFHKAYPILSGELYGYIIGCY